MKRFFKAFPALLIALPLAAGSLLSDEAAAVTEGTLGNTSSGSLNFSVTKPARADISNLSDLQLSNWIAGDGAVTLAEDVCIYSTRPSGGYTVQATGSGAGEAFTLSSGANLITYMVLWNAGGVNSLTNAGISLMSNVVSTGLTNAATDSSSCSGAISGPTARLIVKISETQMNSARNGSYTGTLTLLIMPN